MKNSQLALAFIFLLQFFAFEGLSSEFTLRAGIAKVDITPVESLYLGGYDSSLRGDPSDGIYGKLYVRSLVFDDNTSRSAIIEADITGFSTEYSIALRRLIEDETGIPYENIILGSVHNHAAPTLGSNNSETEWYRQFNNNVLKSVKDAIADLEPVKIGGAIGTSYIAMNRRKRMEDTLSYLTFDENNSSQSAGVYKTDNPVLIREMEGVYRLGSNPKGPIDPEVGIMRIDKLSGRPKAVFVNYACHPTSLGARNNTISPEWNGHMLEYIEEMLPDVTGIFSNGAAGDINPRFVGGLEGNVDCLERTAQLGQEIGREVVRVFNTIQTEYALNPEIKVVNENIVLPLKYNHVMRDFRQTTLDLPVTALKIDEFIWITYPGELFHEIGQQVKASTHSRYSFIVGYGNGSYGYLPTQAAHSEGGYEPNSTRFAPISEKIFVRGIERMLSKLY